MNAAHTPAPWVGERCNPSGGILIEAGAKFGGIIATVWGQRNETQQADADLIKSSPKLLGVLQFLAAQWAEEFDRDLPIAGAELVEWFSEVRTLHILPAIAEARGIKAKVAKPSAPTAVQMRSVRDFAARHGREWKDALLTVWLNGKYDWDRDDSANLQQVRNTLGPDWLATFELPEAFAIVQSSATRHWNYCPEGSRARKRMETDTKPSGYLTADDALAAAKRDDTIPRDATFSTYPAQP